MIGRRIRVLVVEDSLTTRKFLVEVLGADPDFEVVGEAEDGRTAIELVQRLKPDAITLDMMLPVMTGQAVTEYVMAFSPTPILVVSSSTNRGELFRTYDALAAGAVDVLEKPRGDDSDGDWPRRLRAAVKVVSRIRVITHVRAKLGGAGRTPRPPPPRGGSPRAPRLVAIGASTGGPAVLVEILRQLPAEFPLPILLVIHISHPFGTAFAEWLDGLSSIRVRTARDGERLPPPGGSVVLLAPPEHHLEVREGVLRLGKGAPRHSCRPSVDVLFESVARELGASAAGCLLTGMGRDGASGLLAMRAAGALTIAQAEASCVVFGMPKEAIALGAAERVLAPDEIARALIELGQGVEVRR